MLCLKKNIKQKKQRKFSSFFLNMYIFCFQNNNNNNNHNKKQINERKYK